MRKLPLLLLVIFLGGCASKGTKVSTEHLISANDPRWQAHYNSVNQVDTWEAKGKIAASHDGEGGSASFVWENNGQYYKVRMFGPFGAGSAELTGDKNNVTLETGDGAFITAKTPEEVLFQQTGLNIPVRGLAYWIKGVPSPYEPILDMQINDEGQLIFLNQKTWQIIYNRYREEKGQTFPAQMRLTHNGMKVKIIIKSWDIE